MNQSAVPVTSWSLKQVYQSDALSVLILCYLTLLIVTSFKIGCSSICTVMHLKNESRYTETTVKKVQKEPR